MFTEPFTKLEHGAAAALLDLVNPQLEISPFDTASAQIMRTSLPFFNAIDLVEITDPQATPPKKINVLFSAQGKQVFILNWKNEPIYEANKKWDLALNDENVLFYARFFFGFVKGRHGFFNIINNVSDIAWREEPTKAAKQSLSKTIEPLFILEKGEDRWTLQSSIIFKDSLFSAEITVHKDGRVALSNQEILVEDVPVKDEHFDTI